MRRRGASVSGAARAAYWVWRRELHVMLRAPILYVVGGVFLVVQGVAFSGLVTALSDPRRPAPLGALLEGQLAGTLLTWVLSLVVLTLLGMRAIADDKRGGAWELLLTAQVGEGAAVVGKWLAAAAVYALLWIPTLAYLGVVGVLRADDGGWDLAAIACGYAGAIALGAALLAWAVAASAATSSTLGAGALAFTFLIGLFLAGELPALWPELAVDHPRLAAAANAVSIRGAALAFARGEVAASSVALVAGLAVTGLSLAITLACAGRRRSSEIRTRSLGTAAVAVSAVLVGALAARHPARWDVSAAGRNTLDPETVGVLAALPAPATLTIVRPTLGSLDPVYDEVVRVIERMAEVGAVTVHTTDPAGVPGGLDAVARAAGLAPGDLAKTGAVVVEVGARRRVVDVFAIATIDAGPGGAPTVERLAVEQAVAGALAALAAARPVTVCATSGHGELSLEARAADGADWAIVGDRLRAEGLGVGHHVLGPRDPGSAGAASVALDIPRGCDALIVAGPSTPFTPDEALALDAFVRAGGGLLVAAPSRTLAGGVGATGLEAVLARVGLGLPPAIVVDPDLAVRELPGALLVVDGYAAHPINAGFPRTRATLWFQPRPVIVTGDATPLVTASPASWGERDLTSSPPAKHEDDLAGPSILAAASGSPSTSRASRAGGSERATGSDADADADGAGERARGSDAEAAGAGERAGGSGRDGRVVVVGSAESFSSAVLGGGASAGDLWLARAVRYVAGAAEPRVTIAARTPDQIRLVLTAGQRRAVIAMSVAGIPLAWLLGGGALVLWRRRRDPARAA